MLYLESRPKRELVLMPRTYLFAFSHRGETGGNSVVEFHSDDGRRLIDIVDGTHRAGPADKPVTGIGTHTQDDSMSVVVPKHSFSRRDNTTAFRALDSQAPRCCRSSARNPETETSTH